VGFWKPLASEVVESEEVRFLETEEVAALLLVEMRTTLRSYDHWHKKKKKFRFFFGGVLRGRHGIAFSAASPKECCGA
jgi:hypothetical protein